MSDTPTPATTDLAHDIFRSERQPLDPFFSPRNVAVIGATEAANSVGRTLLRNLINTPFGGVVWPVNPKRASVLPPSASAATTRNAARPVTHHRQLRRTAA